MNANRIGIGEALRCDHSEKVGCVFSHGRIGICEEGYHGRHRWGRGRVVGGNHYYQVGAHFGCCAAECFEEGGQGCFTLSVLQPTESAGSSSGDFVILVMQVLDERGPQRANNREVMLCTDVCEGFQTDLRGRVRQEKADGGGGRAQSPHKEYSDCALGYLWFSCIASKPPQVPIRISCGLSQGIKGIDRRFGSNCRRVGCHGKRNRAANNRDGLKLCECDRRRLFPARRVVTNLLQEVAHCVGADLDDGLLRFCLLVKSVPVSPSVKPGAQGATLVTWLRIVQSDPQENVISPARRKVRRSILRFFIGGVWHHWSGSQGERAYAAAETCLPYFSRCDTPSHPPPLSFSKSNYENQISLIRRLSVCISMHPCLSLVFLGSLRPLLFIFLPD